MEALKSVQQNDLTQLFDSQIATLKDRGVPEEAVKQLLKQRTSMLARITRMGFKEGRLPFIPVIPLLFRSVYDQMAMVRNAGKMGYASIFDAADLADVVKTPIRPYYILDVDDGTETLEIGDRYLARFYIKRDKRRVLTVAEVIALAVHTDVLSRHIPEAAASRNDTPPHEIPLLGVRRRDHRPTLMWGCLSCDFHDDLKFKYSTPSCRTRFLGRWW